MLHLDYRLKTRRRLLGLRPAHLFRVQRFYRAPTFAASVHGYPTQKL